jgi:hypothetical protein
MRKRALFSTISYFTAAEPEKYQKHRFFALNDSICACFIAFAAHDLSQVLWNSYIFFKKRWPGARARHRPKLVERFFSCVSNGAQKRKRKAAGAGGALNPKP